MTLNYIKDQSGKHFDPEVVEAFLAIYEVIAAIREKYQHAGLVFSPDCFSLAPWPPPAQKSCFSLSFVVGRGILFLRPPRTRRWP